MMFFFQTDFAVGGIDADHRLAVGQIAGRINPSAGDGDASIATAQSLRGPQQFGRLGVPIL